MHFAASFVASLDVLLQMILHRLERQSQRGAHQYFDEENFAGVVVFDESVERITQVDERNDHRKSGEDLLQALDLVKVAGQDKNDEDKNYLQARKPPGGVPRWADLQLVHAFTGEFTVELARANSENPFACVQLSKLALCAGGPA